MAFISEAEYLNLKDTDIDSATEAVASGSGTLRQWSIDIRNNSPITQGFWVTLTNLFLLKSEVSNVNEFGIATLEQLQQRVENVPKPRVDPAPSQIPLAVGTKILYELLTSNVLFDGSMTWGQFGTNLFDFIKKKKIPWANISSIPDLNTFYKYPYADATTGPSPTPAYISKENLLTGSVITGSSVYDPGGGATSVSITPTSSTVKNIIPLSFADTVTKDKENVTEQADTIFVLNNALVKGVLQSNGEVRAKSIVPTDAVDFGGSVPATDIGSPNRPWDSIFVRRSRSDYERDYTSQRNKISIGFPQYVGVVRGRVNTIIDISSFTGRDNETEGNFAVTFEQFTAQQNIHSFDDNGEKQKFLDFKPFLSDVSVSGAGHPTHNFILCVAEYMYLDTYGLLRDFRIMIRRAGVETSGPRRGQPIWRFSYPDGGGGLERDGARIQLEFRGDSSAIASKSFIYEANQGFSIYPKRITFGTYASRYGFNINITVDNT